MVMSFEVIEERAAIGSSNNFSLIAGPVLLRILPDEIEIEGMSNEASLLKIKIL
jgi:hypothetical protein